MLGGEGAACEWRCVESACLAAKAERVTGGVWRDELSPRFHSTHRFFSLQNARRRVQQMIFNCGGTSCLQGSTPRTGYRNMQEVVNQLAAHDLLLVEGAATSLHPV